MKTLSILLFSLLLSPLAAQPVATTFQKAANMGYDPVALDSIYLPAIHADPAQGVFGEQQGEFIQSYRTLHQDLGNFLYKNDFNWPKRSRLFTRVYFNKDGRIDFFLFNPEKAAISEEQSEQLFMLLNEFISDYRIPMVADTTFAQCSPVTYAPVTQAQ